MNLRKAEADDLREIWEIIRYAIEKRKQEGSEQWQDGYPNEQTIASDLEKNQGYLLEENGVPLLYAAVIWEGEPAYDKIDGKWLTNGNYLVLHRIAASQEAKGKRAATQLLLLMEDLCREKGIQSIKIDTNFDNIPMLRVLEKLDYTYCGEVFFRGASRKAFEKVLGQHEANSPAR